MTASLIVLLALIDLYSTNASWNNKYYGPYNDHSQIQSANSLSGSNFYPSENSGDPRAFVGPVIPGSIAKIGNNNINLLPGARRKVIGGIRMSKPDGGYSRRVLVVSELDGNRTRPVSPARGGRAQKLPPPPTGVGIKSGGKRLLVVTPEERRQLQKEHQQQKQQKGEKRQHNPVKIMRRLRISKLPDNDKSYLGGGAKKRLADKTSAHIIRRADPRRKNWRRSSGRRRQLVVELMEDPTTAAPQRTVRSRGALPFDLPKLPTPAESTKRVAEETPEPLANLKVAQPSNRLPAGKQGIPGNFPIQPLPRNSSPFTGGRSAASPNQFSVGNIFQQLFGVNFLDPNAHGLKPQGCIGKLGSNDVVGGIVTTIVDRAVQSALNDCRTQVTNKQTQTWFDIIPSFLGGATGGSASGGFASRRGGGGFAGSGLAQTIVGAVAKTCQLETRRTICNMLRRELAARDCNLCNVIALSFRPAAINQCSCRIVGSLGGDINKSIRKCVGSGVAGSVLKEQFGSLITFPGC